jgi:predicted transcriptional regulator
MKRHKNQNEGATLTKSEMDVMQRLWDAAAPSTVKDILDRYDEPRPAYTTVATFLKILCAKGFVEERKPESGKALLFHPSISREDYTRRVMSDVTDSFFGGSVKSLVSFFVSEEKIDAKEIQELLKLIQP